MNMNKKSSLVIALAFAGAMQSAPTYGMNTSKAMEFLNKINWKKTAIIGGSALTLGTIIYYGIQFRNDFLKRQQELHDNLNEQKITEQEQEIKPSLDEQTTVETIITPENWNDDAQKNERLFTFCEAIGTNFDTFQTKYTQKTGDELHIKLAKNLYKILRKLDYDLSKTPKKFPPKVLHQMQGLVIAGANPYLLVDKGHGKDDSSYDLYAHFVQNKIYVEEQLNHIGKCFQSSKHKPNKK